MRQTHIVTALAIFAITGIVGHSQSLAEAWQGNTITHLSGMMATAVSVSNEQQQGQKSSAQLDQSLIHKVQQVDVYSGMTSPAGRPGGMSSQQGSILGDQSRQTGESKAGSPSTEGRYGSNPSDNYFQKESSERTNSPYGGSVYGGGVPATPSADPMIKGLNRDPSMR